MGLLSCNGAQCLCTFGAAPCPLVVLPVNKVLAQNQPAANIQDKIPFLNIPGFALCMSLANPAVAGATAAALGVLTPMPCTPMLPAPWIPGQFKTMIGGVPALDMNSKLTCAYGGMISIIFPGQMKVMAN